MRELLWKRNVYNQGIGNPHRIMNIGRLYMGPQLKKTEIQVVRLGERNLYALEETLNVTEAEGLEKRTWGASF